MTRMTRSSWSQARFGFRSYSGGDVGKGRGTWKVDGRWELETRVPDVGSRSQKNQGARLFSLNIALHIVAWFILGLMVAVSLMVTLWIAFGKPSIQDQSANGVGPSMLFNASKLALGVVAGMGGVVALVVATRRQRLGEADHDRQERATNRDETRLFTERFAQATQQLGSDQAAVRVAGVYALAGLADDWPAGRQTCVDVLCAYIRMPFRPRDGLPSLDPNRGPGIRRMLSLREGLEDPGDGRMSYPAGEEHQVRLTILSAMRQRMSRDAEIRWIDLNLDFTGAIFDEASFAGFRFENCDIEFTECIFLGHTSFDRCAVLRSRLSFAGCIYLGNIGFKFCRFEDATVDLFGDFGEASSRVNFNGSILEGGEINVAGPRGARGCLDFTAAQLEDGYVTVFGAEMNGGSLISFNMATISGDIDIKGGTYTAGKVAFERANFDGGRVTFDSNRPDTLSKMALGGTDFSFDGVNLLDGGIRFGSADVVGSWIHFDGLSMAGGAIEFVDVSLTAGEITMDDAKVTGGVIDLGEIAETDSGRAIASAAGKFLHTGPPISRFP